MTVFRHPVIWCFFVMALLVATATIVVTIPAPTNQPKLVGALACPTLAGVTGRVYCENVSVPAPSSGQPCAVGTNASGIFHNVTFSFHRYFGCGLYPVYGLNGTVDVLGSAAQPVMLWVLPPDLREWTTYTSPDGRVLVAWLGLAPAVNLTVAA